MSRALGALRELLSVWGYAEKDLADLLDVHVSTVSRWLNGKNRVPARVVPKLAAAFGITLHEALEAVYPIDALLEDHDLPLSLEESLREEQLQTGATSYLEDVTKAVQIVEALAPTSEQRRRRFREISRVEQADDRLERYFDYYVDHRVDHYVMALLSRLPAADEARAEELFGNLWRLAEAAGREEEPRRSPSHFRYRDNSLAYLIFGSPPESRDEAYREAKMVWLEGGRSGGNLLVVRDSFRTALNVGLPEAERYVSELLAKAFDDSSSLDRSLKRVILGAEALYYDPTLGRELGPGRLLPEMSQLGGQRGRRIFEALLDHLPGPDPEGFKVNLAAALLLWLQETDLMRQLDLRFDPALASRLLTVLEMPEPPFSSPDFRMLWRLLRRRISDALQAA